MKIDIVSDDEIVVFLNKKHIKNLCFEDNEKLEDYLRSLFQLLIKEYDVDVDGYYVIDVYTDDNYGWILQINREEGTYYNYFDNQIDMKINIHVAPVIYEIDYNYLNKEILKHSKVYCDNNKLYIKLKDKIDDIILGNIIERGKIIFGNKSFKILKNSHEVIL